MNTIARRLRISAISLAVLLASIELMPARSAPPPQSANPTPCSEPEYHQFDFWLGDWDAFDIGSTQKNAHLRVDRILEGCVIREDYQGADGHKGESFSLYDASRKVWHQTWVTNRGELLIIEGTFQAGQIVLTGSDLTPAGQKREVRGTWKQVEGAVRETAVTSTDAGKTWNPWFDIVFRPHKP
jgi:hypothetical protein